MEKSAPNPSCTPMMIEIPGLEVRVRPHRLVEDHQVVGRGPERVVLGQREHAVARRPPAPSAPRRRPGCTRRRTPPRSAAAMGSEQGALHESCGCPWLRRLPRLHAEAGHERPFLIRRGRLVTVPQLVQPGEVGVHRRGVDHQQPRFAVPGVAEGVRGCRAGPGRTPPARRSVPRRRP